jgi:hypothetical protein
VGEIISDCLGDFVGIRTLAKSSMRRRLLSQTSAVLLLSMGLFYPAQDQRSVK